MQITLRQRELLGLLRVRQASLSGKSISEHELHMMMSIANQGLEHDDQSSTASYQFALDHWHKIDPKFDCKFGAVPISTELHQDIEDLVSKCYLTRSQEAPIELSTPFPEFFYGIWFSINQFGRFAMQILGKRRKSESVEEIGGEIDDDLGSAGFFGEREAGKIKFAKQYDPNSHPSAIKDTLHYSGTRQGIMYRGTWIVMSNGEIPRTGNFVLASSQKDLPDESEYEEFRPTRHM